MTKLAAGLHSPQDRGGDLVGMAGDQPHRTGGVSHESTCLSLE